MVAGESGVRLMNAFLSMMSMMSGSLAMAGEPAAAAANAAGAVAKPAAMTAAECEVWSRELSFAKSVEAHDATAFAAHLHSGTVFSAGTAAPVRGRAAVVADWKEIIEGKTIVLRWHPAFVSIGGDPHIALSSGPAWIEDPDPKSKQRYSILHFTSTWVKEPDGQWRVLFDGAGAPPKPASADDIAKLVAQQAAVCPRG